MCSAGSRSEMIAELELLNASHCQMIQELKQENEATRVTCMKEIAEYHSQISDQDVRVRWLRVGGAACISSVASFPQAYIQQLRDARLDGEEQLKKLERELEVPNHNPDARVFTEAFFHSPLANSARLISAVEAATVRLQST